MPQREFAITVTSSLCRRGGLAQGFLPTSESASSGIERHYLRDDRAKSDRVRVLFRQSFHQQADEVCIGDRERFSGIALFWLRDVARQRRCQEPLNALGRLK